jgi:NADH dehydrogenase
VKVFLTGGSGFVGARVLRALLQGGHRVVALDRSGSVKRSFPGDSHLQVVVGDLLTPESYSGALDGVEAVVHLAASTGRAPAAEHFRVNADGTGTLLEQSRRRAVGRFLFVSSIAAGFADTSSYPYAQAKIRAETLVRQSGLRFAILRPTVILGRGSPIFAALAKLAMAPVIPIFGSGKTLVQPVDADDVARCIVRVLDDDLLSNDTFDIGGAEPLTIQELIVQIRRIAGGRDGRVLHVPLPLVLPPLRIAERLGLGRVLPLSVGQLATFRFDGVVAPNPLFERCRDTLVGLPRMLAESAGAGADRESRLERECRIFCRFLIARRPDGYVARKYLDAQRGAAFDASSASRLDQHLLNFASRHPLCTRIADSYARLFAPASLLRRKLVLLLAILESSAPFSRVIDSVPNASRARAVIGLAAKGSLGVLSAILGVLIFGPVRLAGAMGRRR